MTAVVLTAPADQAGAFRSRGAELARIKQVHSACNSWACVARVRHARHVRLERREARLIRRLGVKAIAYLALRRRGDLDQFGCLDALWHRESGWSATAHNSSSGAHGIPQALPGWKMGPGWESNPRVQIRWGLRYVYGRYGSPCNANFFQARNGWY